jgi:hypothetical protein
MRSAARGWPAWDHLVKRDGRWLIKSRKLVVFTD